MSRALQWLLRRFRPAIGWPLALLALGAALAPAIAAADSAIDLPAGIIGWAGVLGLLLGADLGRAPLTPPAPRSLSGRGGGDSPPTVRGRGRGWGRLRWLGAALLSALGCGLLLAAAGQALPPAALLARDAGALLSRAARGDSAPYGLSARFLQESLPRLWRDLRAAPDAGPAGARLITICVGVLGAWPGALLIGWAVTARRPTLGWSLPALAAAGASAILGGGSGAGLPPALALILALAAASQALSLRQSWERTGADYSDEIVPQVGAWGGLLIALTLLGALAIPVAPPGWLNAWLWGRVELPSGIAAIESQVQRPGQAAGQATVGLSQLPALALGRSLQQGPDEQPALRITTGAPLGESAWPRYWRARVLERYSGRGWASAATVGAPLSPLAAAGELPGGVVQAVEDLRPQRLTLVGLPVPVAGDAPARAERLPDGSLAALSANTVPARYRLLSLPPDLSAPAGDSPPPDMGAFLRLPAGLPARVRELARSLAADTSDPYEQALALEGYLRGLPYSYQVAPLPPTGDAVDQFLFSMRQGYCTYYASAMAVMARSLGIPARLAVGYAPGQYDPALGAYTVREAEAHAWPELYIGGRWRAFEPTPIRPLPARAGTVPAPATTPAPTPPPLPARAPTPGVLIAAVALAALLAGWLLWRRRAAPPLARAIRRLELRGARVGRPWPAGASLREYGGRLSLPPALLAQIEAATYGRQPPDRRQQAALARDLDRASAALRRHKGGQPGAW